MTEPAGNGSTGPRAWLRDHAWLLVPFSAIVLCYLPAWTTEYGFSEDYRLLSFYQHGATNRTLMIAEGRPLQALWTNLVFGNIDGIGSLKAVRFSSIALLGFVAALLALAWLRSGLRRWEAGMAGAAMLTLPPFQMVAADAAFGVKPFVLIAAVVAALALNDGLSSASKKQRRFAIAAAIVLLSLALMGYQPAAMIYWTVAAILLLAPEHETDAARRKLAWFAVVGLVAIFAGFVAYLAGRSIHATELTGQARSSLHIDPIQKLLWFLTNPLVQSLNLWRLYPDRFLALAMALVLEAGLILHLMRFPNTRFRFAAALTLLPLSYLPNLMVREDWAAFRTQFALVSTVWVFFVIALRTQAATKRRWIFALGLPAATLAGLYSASRNVSTLIVGPQSRELALVREHLARVPAAYNSIGVRRADERRTLAAFALWDEFGRSSTSFPWSTTALPWLVLREQRPGTDTAAIRVHDVDVETAPVDTVIDWDNVLRAAGAR